VVLVWLAVAGTVYAWPVLRQRNVSTAGRPALSLGVGAVVAILVFWVVSTVNVELVRADIIYKQGQQFDNQRNWLSSIELYRRALNARATEDYYMLFLGRAFLEQAKQVNPEGAYQMSANPTIDEVLELAPERVSQMGRYELLRAAEVVLREAQAVNPLNTDHTANLARLYRSWSDLAVDNPEMRQEMLDKSIAAYEMAVTLSPNAAHLWNEKGNTHLARGERPQAEESYLQSLSLDPMFEQTYLLLADFYDAEQRCEDMVKLLQDGIARMDADPRFNPSATMYSYLGVCLARTGDLPGAIAANEQVLALQPNNVGAMRNLALLYRDHSQPAEAVVWVEQALSLTSADQSNELATLLELAAQLYQATNQGEKAVESLERLRQLAPDDVNTLKNLSDLYNSLQNDGKVVEMAQLLLQLEPDNYTHSLSAAQALQRLGQPESALSFANRALDLAPEDQKATINELIESLEQSS
jgi:tetratricopeptide (TPR) repeat protein